MRESACTAILTCHNDRDSVGRALQSIWNQTFEDLDIIVVDDGSTDDSVTTVENLLHSLAPANPHRAARTTILRRDNGGPSSARNSGIAAAKSRFVAFLDADDEWLPDKCRHQVAMLTETGYGLVGGNFYYRGARSLFPVRLSPRRGRTVSFAATLFKYYFTPSCVMCRTDVIRHCGEFPENQHFVEDAYAFSACTRLAPAMVCGEYYAIKQLHGPDKPGLSSRIKEMDRWEAVNLRRLWRENGHRGPKHSPLLFCLATAMLPVRRLRRRVMQARLRRKACS